MADELEPVVQQFEADVAPYVEEMRAAGDEARHFAEENRLSDDAVHELVHALEENSAALDTMTFEYQLANDELSKFRDRELEAAAATEELGAAQAAASAEASGSGGMIPMMAGIVAVAALVGPAVAAAGLGLGAFGLFAIPTIKSVFTGLQSVAQAQQAVNTATTAAGRSTALKRLHEIWASMPGPIAATVRSIQDFVHAFGQIAARSGIQTAVLTDIAKVMGILKSVLPVLVPLAQQGAVAFGSLLGSLSAGVKSAGFLSFMREMTSMVVPATKSIVALAGALLSLLGKALLALAPISVPFINLLTHLVTTLSGPLLMVIRQVVGVLQFLIPQFNSFLNLLSKPSVQPFIAGLIGLFLAFKSIVMVLGILRPALALLSIEFETTPVGLVITAIALLVVAFIELWKHCAAFRDFWKGLWKDIQAIMAPVTAWIHNILENMSRWWHDHGAQVMKIVKEAWTYISAVIKIDLTLIGGLLRAEFAVWSGLFRAAWAAISIIVRTAWTVIYTIISVALRTIQDIIAMVMDLIHGHWSAAWGRLQDIASVQMHGIENVIRAVGSGFITLLEQAGRDLIQGLINGITSMAGAVGHAISSVVGGVVGFGKKLLGLGSPSRIFHEYGINTILGFVNGLMVSAPGVRAAMNSIFGGLATPALGTPAIAYGAYAASAVAPAAAPAQAVPRGDLIINVDGIALLRILQSQIYRYNIRNSGQVTGKLVPG